jgi:hypothetical protein
MNDAANPLCHFATLVQRLLFIVENSLPLAVEADFVAHHHKREQYPQLGLVPIE